MKLEFTEGQGIQTKNFLWVVCGYFLEQHIAITYNVPKLFSWKSLFMTLLEYKLNEKNNNTEAQLWFKRTDVRSVVS